MLQENFISFQRFRYAKWALALVVLVVTLYAADSAPQKPGGGTLLGYGLGTLGALLIGFLLALGMRKRAYRSQLGSVRGWLSAHVYLGLALAAVATLHCAFEFGPNVHTLAYGLTIAVIVSGIWGVVLYLRHPALMGNLLDGRTLMQHAQELREIDARCAMLALGLAPNIGTLVAESAATAVFASFWQRLGGQNRRCATTAVLAQLRALNDQANAAGNEILTLQFRRLQQLKRIRQFVRLRTLTELWLLCHVPMSIALLMALTAHIIAVFFYW